MRSLLLNRCLYCGLMLLMLEGLSRDAAAVVTFDWATVGDVNNAPDTLVMTKTGSTADMTSGYGSVGYAYRIAKQHVTNAQYTEFLNAVDTDGTNELDLYDDRMEQWYHPTSFLPFEAYTGGIDFDAAAPEGSKYTTKPGKENYPATWINWESGARFANWLHNDQGLGPATTASGVYDMTLLTGSSVYPVSFPPRQAGARFFMPSENEFYKAAYYDPTKNGGAGGYWQYGVQSDSPPLSEAPSAGSTSANYTTAAGDPGVNGDLYWQSGGGLFNISLNHLTDVGAYTNATSHYGLHDVDGLIYQWTEGTKVLNLPAGATPFPVYRGGSWAHSSESNGAAFRHLYSWATADSYAFFGLRIASAVPVLFGDFNADGLVDAADYTVWRDNWGATDEAPLNGAGSGDSFVNEDDYALWRAHFGDSMANLQAPVSAASVPEPTSMSVAAVIAVALVLRSHWNRPRW